MNDFLHSLIIDWLPLEADKQANSPAVMSLELIQSALLLNH